LSARGNAAACFALWGSELSPFALKVEALLRFHGVTHCWAPAHVGTREAFRLARRRRALVAGRRPLTWPDKHPLDEYPLVPFLFGADGENLYDSSAIAEWLDRRAVGRDPRAPRLVPDGDPALRFAVRLVDEALDEVGLYLVHHARWVVAAAVGGAGIRPGLWAWLRSRPGTGSGKYLFVSVPIDVAAGDIHAPLFGSVGKELNGWFQIAKLTVPSDD